MNRKGYIFTTLAIFFSVIIVFIVAQSQPQETINPQTRYVTSMNDFLSQLEEDLSRVIGITGYRTLIGVEEHIAATGNYTENFEVTFQEALLNGTINGTTYDIFDEATLTQFELRMNDISNRLGYLLAFRIRNVSARHVSPWDINVTVLLDVYAQSQDGRTTFNYTTNSSAVFHIEDLRDPIWTVGTLGRVPALVKQSNVSRPLISPTNDTRNLRIVLNETMYVENNQAPSMLMRFEGNFSPSPYGISALVDKKILDSQGIPVQNDKSVADFRYFANYTNTTLQIVNMSSDFYLYEADLPYWDAEDKTI